MNYTEISERMRSLKLLGMASALEGILQSKQGTHLSSEQLLAVLVQQEYDERHNRKIHRLTQQARFRYAAQLEQIHPSGKRNLDATQLASLSSCKWISKGENLLITGPTGVGKSYLGTAFGNQGCLFGYRVLYYNCQKLFYSLRLAKMDGTHRKLITSLDKSDLLILDDFGLQRLDENNRMDLMEIIEDRHGNKSTIVCSQLPVSSWHEIIAEPTLADAIMDRLTANAHKIELKGESKRKSA